MSLTAAIRTTSKPIAIVVLARSGTSSYRQIRASAHPSLGIALSSCVSTTSPTHGLSADLRRSRTRHEHVLPAHAPRTERCPHSIPRWGFPRVTALHGDYSRDQGLRPLSTPK